MSVLKYIQALRSLINVLFYCDRIRETMIEQNLIASLEINKNVAGKMFSIIDSSRFKPILNIGFIIEP